jgi:hypothetical protein
MQSLTQQPAWQNFHGHRQAFDKIHMPDLFDGDDSCAQAFLLLVEEFSSHESSTRQLINTVKRNTG